MDIDYTTKISSKDIMAKYNLSQKAYDNLRRRTGERIANARSLYNWSEADVPKINQLIDYSLKRRKYDVQRFEVILKTPASKTPSLKSKYNALKSYAGYESAINQGFQTFSQGIHQFQVLFDNSDRILSGRGGELKRLELFSVGSKFSDTENYYFKNTKSGRDVVSKLNDIVQRYNSKLSQLDKSNALSVYIDTVRDLMNVINYGDKNDAIAGS